MKGSIMKQLIFIAAGFGVIIALGIGLNRAKTSHDSLRHTTTASTPIPSPQPPPRLEAPKTATPLLTSNGRTARQPMRSPAAVPTVFEMAEERAFREALATLLSPQSTFEQKQAAWKQLKNAGKLDDAIAELERLVADNPQSVEDTIALGEAYLKKCGQTGDIRLAATLAMKADQVLDTALSMDPSNLEAQFDKVSAMAHWPLELNQGPKVLEQFQTLIQEQESQPAQPQFALTYVRLGDFYQKAGEADAAVQVWQRGAVLFPDNTDLRAKLSPAP
jgi:hypothetical protein